MNVDGVTTETVNTEFIEADEADLEEINTDDLTAQVGHIADAHLEPCSRIGIKLNNKA